MVSEIDFITCRFLGKILFDGISFSIADIALRVFGKSVTLSRRARKEMRERRETSSFKSKKK